MKLIKIIASFLLITGIFVLMFWAFFRAKNQTCTEISILINAQKESQLLTKQEISTVLNNHNIECEGKAIKEVELSSIKEILAQENYIKSVDKVHFLGSKLQIEVTLYDILLEVEPQNGKKFLVDTEGTLLPTLPNVNYDVIFVNGFISNAFHNKEMISPENKELTALYDLASLIKADPFYAALFRHLYMNDKQEIILFPSVGKMPVLFGKMNEAESKLKALKYLYDEVIPYLNEDKYAQLDVRFKNRIVATKTKS
jgi:cell division protein FtsQ